MYIYIYMYIYTDGPKVRMTFWKIYMDGNFFGTFRSRQSSKIGAAHSK